jgi:hypothetical protein
MDAHVSQIHHIIDRQLMLIDVLKDRCHPSAAASSAFDAVDDIALLISDD